MEKLSIISFMCKVIVNNLEIHISSDGKNATDKHWIPQKTYSNSMKNIFIFAIANCY